MKERNFRPARVSASGKSFLKITRSFEKLGTRRFLKAGGFGSVFGRTERIHLQEKGTAAPF